MDYLKEAIRIAHLAGNHIKVLRERNNYSLHVKNYDELVTSADLESNDIIKREILNVFPSHNYISEEDYDGSHIEVEHPTWIVDPIDGTVGYSIGHYQVAVSIAFAQNNSIKLGVVYNPFLNETFYATECSGAYLNDQRINVSFKGTLKESVIGTGIPHNRENLNCVLYPLAKLLPKVRDIRRMGSPALDICWVACGRLQGYYEPVLFPWDVAAARFIALMADASVGHYGGATSSDATQIINGNNVIVAAPSIYEDLLTILNKG